MIQVDICTLMIFLFVSQLGIFLKCVFGEDVASRGLGFCPGSVRKGERQKLVPDFYVGIKNSLI
jgi:hypothetical protein